MNMTGTVTIADGLEFDFDVTIQPEGGAPRASFAITGGTIQDSLGVVTLVHPRLMTVTGLAKNRVPSAYQLKRLLTRWIEQGEI
ncbi:hypothetical protein ACFJGW_15390 [Burkholderiaceae bacterium UC74_6]